MDAISEFPKFSAPLAQEALPKPKAKPRGRAFSADEARLAQAKSCQAKLAQKLAPAPPEPLQASRAVLTPPQPHLTETERKRLVGAYKELCEASRKQLAILTDPKDRHQEASTLAKLEAALWRYAGIPGEGTLKPQADKPDRRRVHEREPS